MIVRISTGLYERLLALAEADEGREVCGLLLGQCGAIEAIVEAANVAEAPDIAFEIEPRVQIDALREARAGGRAVIGCYHSHPSGLARPSAQDLAMAEPGSLWLIVGGGDVAAWRRNTDAFEAASLVVV